MHWSLIPHDPWPLQELGQYPEVVVVNTATSKAENLEIMMPTTFARDALAL